MSQSLHRLLTSHKLSVLKSYRAVVDANTGYYSGQNVAGEDDGLAAPRDSTLYDGFMDGSSSSPAPPIDPDALRYLVDVVGVPADEIRGARWASCSGPSSGRVLVAPAEDAGRLLAVRAVRERSSDELYKPSDVTLDPSERLRESNPEAALSIDDVPVPFRRGLFDKPATWVSHDPVDALLLQHLGVNATSLADPFGTLGSREGLWHLQDRGAISHRGSGPQGTLVIVDPATGPTPEQAGLLNGQFGEVWALGEGYTGPKLWLRAKQIHKQRFFSMNPVEAFTGGMRTDRLSPLRVHPVALPPRSEWSAMSDPPQPFTFVPVSELYREKAPGREWLVEEFIAPGTITQFLGGSKAGKSTLLLAMLAEVSRGGTFLGRKCKESAVLYVTEQGWGPFGDSLERSLPAGTTPADLPKLHVLTAEKLYGRSWADVLALVRSTSKQVDASVVVFDTLSEAADVHGDAENSAGASRMLYRSLRGLVGDGVAVVAVRHTRKTERGGIAEAGLGSVANSGAADHLVWVKEVAKDSNVRSVETKGRISDAKTFRMELTPDGFVRRAGSSDDGDKKPGKRPLRAQVLKALKDKEGAGLKLSDLLAVLKPVPTAGLLRRTLTDLIQNGKVEQEKLSERGNPSRYRLCSIPSTP